MAGTNVRRVGAVLNPVAGGGRALRLLPRVGEALAAAGWGYHLHVTVAPGDATAVARRFAEAGMALVLSVGGDGTLNEVANGLLDAGGETRLAIVPAGRGSDFARTAGAWAIADLPARLRSFDPDDPDAVRRIDVGRVRFDGGRSRAFVNVAGVGFDAAVSARAARSHLPGATAPYLSGLLGALARYRNGEVTIEADGVATRQRALAVVLANGQYFGGGMRIAPDAALDNGTLDLAVLGDLGKADLLRNVARVYRGTHGTHPKFSCRPVRQARVVADPSLLVELDGEVVGSAPATFTVEPGALRVVAR